DNLMNKNRHIMGIGTIKMGVAARGVLASIRKGKIVAMLSDQDAGSDGVIVDLFGLPASTPKGPAAFALKSKKPIAIGFIVREKGPFHRFICTEPITIEPTGDKEEDIKALTQRYTGELEKYIRLHPDHWFWAHRRFKSTLK
ncbi:MAG: lysophospholipid acyltransferase family protein, partial [candidate division Zixibacteria bacterium]|nr:lysophospholipid acyltransferase family protein [candidate division Zixibacteria bacterium]